MVRHARIHGYDGVGVPGHNLFQGHIIETPAWQAAVDDIDRASAFDDLRVDRASVAGFQPASAAGEVDARSLLRRDGCRDAIDVAQDVLHPSGELLGALLGPEDASEEP